MHPMNRTNSWLGAGSLLAVLVAAACGGAAPEEQEGAGVTAYEGARVIVGNGDVIETGTILVEEDRLTAVGGSASVEVPEGAARVDLSGRTVMPAIIDTHVHLRAEDRDTLVEDLQRKAYYGVAAVLSLGRGTGEAAFAVRDEVIPDAARYLTVDRGRTPPR